MDHQTKTVRKVLTPTAEARREAQVEHYAQAARGRAERAEARAAGLPSHAHEAWQVRPHDGQPGDYYCAACGDVVRERDGEWVTVPRRPAGAVAMVRVPVEDIQDGDVILHQGCQVVEEPRWGIGSLGGGIVRVVDTVGRVSTLLLSPGSVVDVVRAGAR